MLGEGDDEGWVRARNYKGEVKNLTNMNNLGIWFSAPCNYANNIKVGYVPRSYLEIEGLGSEGRQNNSQVFMGTPLLQQGFSFSSVDYSSTSIDFHPLEPIPEGVTVHFPPQSPPDAPKVAS